MQGFGCTLPKLARKPRKFHFERQPPGSRLASAITLSQTNMEPHTALLERTLCSENTGVFVGPFFGVRFQFGGVHVIQSS